MIERYRQIRGEQRRALYSECERYRYLLEVRWNPDRGAEFCQFVGLNPSTATETSDDPTLRRCKSFAAGWGYGGVLMTNAAAFRATDPQEMLSADEAIGAENTPEWIAALGCDLVVCAWGVWGDRCLDGQCDAIRAALGHRAHYLRLTKSGSPAHPLYLPKTLTPQPWGEPGGAG